MWSGPRNLSTTMMRSFGGRADTVCSDEPFYGAYLKATGLDHPMADEIVRHHATDAAQICADLVGTAPASTGGKAPLYWYQKHMCHHMLTGFPTSFMDNAIHIFLIRDPARVIASWVKKHPRVTLDDIGIVQQKALYDFVSQRYGAPPVIDTDLLLEDPESHLKALCKTIDIPWDAGMLHWQPGRQPEDGVWGNVWYDAVWQSEGFGKPSSAPSPLPDAYCDIAKAAKPTYEAMRQTLV